MECVIDKESFIQEYPLLGAKKYSEKYNLNYDTVRNWAWKLKIKMIRTRKKKFCSECNKPIHPYAKYILCRNCSAKLNYSRRGSFTNKQSKLWTKSEIKDLRYYYPNNSINDLKYLFGRSWISIRKKAKQLNLKRNPKFEEQRKLNAIEIIKEYNKKQKREKEKQIQADFVDDKNKLIKIENNILW